MSLIARLAAAALVAVAAAGCTVYEVAPGVYQTVTPSTYDRAWNAALGALQDEGVQITRVDRASSMITGQRGSIEVRANVRAQADGSTRVAFETSGLTSQDPTLIERVSRAYDVRMGR